MLVFFYNHIQCSVPFLHTNWWYIYVHDVFLYKIIQIMSKWLHTIITIHIYKDEALLKYLSVDSMLICSLPEREALYPTNYKRINLHQATSFHGESWLIFQLWVGFDTTYFSESFLKLTYILTLRVWLF